jgi:NAD+ diphosphatase
MDHYQRSSRNLFTASSFDRASDRRQDEQWLVARQQDPRTCFLPLWHLKHLISRESPFKPILMSAQECADYMVNDSGISLVETTILMGMQANRAYFSLILSASLSVPDRLAALGQFQDLRRVAALLAPQDAALLAQARAIAYWHQRHRFCGDCGSPTVSREAGYLRVCSNDACGQHHFPRTDPAIIVLVESGDRALFGRKSTWPKGQYSTIAGFVEPGESIEDAVIREVGEETGVRVGEMHYQSSQPWPFPSSLMLGFRACAVDDTIQVDYSELEDAQWLTRREIRAGLEDKSLRLPPSISVSFRLIEGWFDEGQEGKLGEILSTDT